MTMQRGELQILWSAASNLSIAAGAASTSDAMTITTETFQATITLKADNDGTAASGDVVTFYWLGSAGDPDGASTEEYASSNHGEYLTRIDTFVDEPGLSTKILSGAYKSGKVRAVNASAGRAITVSACINEVRDV